VSISSVLQQPVSLLLTTTNVTDVLDFPASSIDSMTLNRWVVVNRDSTDRKVTLWWHDGTTAYAIFEGIVGANSTMWDDEVDIKLFAKSAAKKIQAQAAVANQVTVTLVTSRTPQNRDASQPPAGY
jgi:hypothetical protein